MDKEQFDKGKKQVNNYLRYSGLGFQLAASIGLGVFIGYWVDKWLHTKQPYFTLLFAILFMAVGMYSVFKELLKKK